MRNFDRDNRNDTRGPRFEKKSFGPKKFGGDRGGDRSSDRSERSYDKPRFGGGDRGGFGRSSGGDRPMMHEATCSACGNSCQVPFRPNGRKPIFCSACFEKQGGGASNERTFDKPRFSSREDRAPRFGGDDSAAQKINENLRDQLREVNAKLDRILRALDKNEAPKKGFKDFSSDSGLDLDEKVTVVTDEESEESSVEKAPKKPKTAKSFPKKAGKAKK